MGINQYYKAKFLAMVNGEAHRPFVCRALLPWTVKAVSSVAPTDWKQSLAVLAHSNDVVRRAFVAFRWESDAAFEYATASLLMFLCFAGFGRVAVKLIAGTCGISAERAVGVVLLAFALGLLPVLFRYVSYIYDPPQLFLFTAGLYALFERRGWMFFFVFALCSINKETALLLIPLFAVAYRGKFSEKRYLSVILILAAVYSLIRGLIFLAFRNNPGAAVEFHFHRNLIFLKTAWMPASLVLSALLVLIFHDWDRKPPFLKYSLPIVLGTLGTFSLFFGFIDEWRGYYEAYPLMLASSVHSFLALKEKARLKFHRTSIP
ncbi:MAG: hypothetical protein QHI48_04650 [Bacteroidota bacterium]|nr:hypothetical protein [Bacteroidota bacterium]